MIPSCDGTTPSLNACNSLPTHLRVESINTDSLNPKMPSGSRVLTLIAFALSAYMLFAGLGGPALIQPDEGRSAEVAREMNESGNWLIPTHNGMVYLDKPAF